MIYLDAGATTLQKPHAVALAVQSAMRRMATPGLRSDSSNGSGS